MTDELGKLIGGLLQRAFPESDFRSVVTAIEKGDLETAVDVLRMSEPGVGIFIDEIGRHGAERYMDAGSNLGEALSIGDYETFFRTIEGVVDFRRREAQLSNPYAGRTSDVADRLVGSWIQYHGDRALIIETEAFSSVGGSDQTMPESTPGTVGYWHSKKMGGFDIPLISAHVSGDTGVVAIRRVRPYDGTKLEKANGNKTDITRTYGFLEHAGTAVGDQVLVDLRKVGKTFDILGRNHRTDYDRTPSIGVHKLKRA